MQSPPGTVIGYVKQDCSFVYPSFSILNAEEETVLKIRGPCFTCRACQAEFEVSTPYVYDNSVCVCLCECVCVCVHADLQYAYFI